MPCHCGRDVYVEDFGGLGEPFTRNMCEECSLVRCDLGDVRCPYDARPGEEVRGQADALARVKILLLTWEARRYLSPAVANRVRELRAVLSGSGTDEGRRRAHRVETYWRGLPRTYGWQCLDCDGEAEDVEWGAGHAAEAAMRHGTLHVHLRHPAAAAGTDETGGEPVTLPDNPTRYGGRSDRSAARLPPRLRADAVVFDLLDTPRVGPRLRHVRPGRVGQGGRG